MQAPIISEDIWGDEPVVVGSYYTVHVYRYDGMGNEATFTNVLAATQSDACERIQASHKHLRLRPMAAYKQEGRN